MVEFDGGDGPVGVDVLHAHEFGRGECVNAKVYADCEGVGRQEPPVLEELGRGPVEGDRPRHKVLAGTQEALDPAQGRAFGELGVVGEAGVVELVMVVIKIATAVATNMLTLNVVLGRTRRKGTQEPPIEVAGVWPL